MRRLCRAECRPILLYCRRVTTMSVTPATTVLGFPTSTMPLSMSSSLAVARRPALSAIPGRTPDQGSENLAAALTVAAKQGGLRKIDTLAMSDDGSQVFVADVIIPKTLNNVASVDTVPAIQTPVEQSSQKIDQVNVDLA